MKKLRLLRDGRAWIWTQFSLMPIHGCLATVSDCHMPYHPQGTAIFSLDCFLDPWFSVANCMSLFNDYKYLKFNFSQTCNPGLLKPALLIFLGSGPTCQRVFFASSLSINVYNEDELLGEIILLPHKWLYLSIWSQAHIHSVFACWTNPMITHLVVCSYTLLQGTESIRRKWGWKRWVGFDWEGPWVCTCHLPALLPPVYSFSFRSQLIASFLWSERVFNGELLLSPLEAPLLPSHPWVSPVCPHSTLCYPDIGVCHLQVSSEQVQHSGNRG